MRMIFWAVLACVAITVMAAEVQAEEAKPVVVTIAGVLNVETKDGKVTEAKVTTQSSVVYYIVLDAKGKSLAGEGNAKTVSVTGKTVEKDGKNWMTVTKHEVLKITL